MALVLDDGRRCAHRRETTMNSTEYSSKSDSLTPPGGATNSSTVQVPPFPDDAFRGIYGTHRKLLGPTTEAPDPMHFGAMASCLSFLVGRDTGLRSATGKLFPNLNVALLAGTGEFKSTTINDTRDAVVARFIPVPSVAGEPPKMVAFDGSGSGEGFLQAIADTEYLPPNATTPVIVTGRRVLLTFHEIGEILAKIKRDQAGNLNEVILGSLDARSQVTHVTKGKVLKITDGLIVILAATTFESMARMLSFQANSSGVVNRMLWLGGQSTSRIARRPAANPEVEAALLKEVAHVLSVVQGKEMTVEKSADALHEAKYGHHRDRPASSALRQATRRAPDQALKLGMLLAIGEGRTIITERDVRVAWDIVEYARHYVGLLVDMIPDSGYGELEDRVLEKAKELALLGNGTFTLSGLYQRLKSRSLSWHPIKGALKVHVERGAIKLVPGSENRFFIVGEPPVHEAPPPAPLPFPYPVVPFVPAPQGAIAPASSASTSQVMTFGVSSSTAPTPTLSPAPVPLPAPYVPGVNPVVVPPNAPPVAPKQFTPAPVSSPPGSVPPQPWLIPPPVDGHGK